MTEQPNADPAPAQNFTQSTQYNDQTASTSPNTTGGSESSSKPFDVRELLTIRAMARYATWFTALLTFAIMSSIWYRAHSSWHGTLAFGVISWLFTMIMLVAYFLKPLYHEKFGRFVLMGEMAGDVFFIIFGFITNLVGAIKCNDGSVYDLYGCVGEVEAAIAFGFITTFLHVFSLILSLFHFRVKK